MVVMVLAGSLSLIKKFQAEVDARYSKDKNIYHKIFRPRTDSTNNVFQTRGRRIVEMDFIEKYKLDTDSLSKDQMTMFVYPCDSQ